MKAINIEEVNSIVYDILWDCNNNDNLSVIIDEYCRKITIYSYEPISSREVQLLSETFKDDNVLIDCCGEQLQIIVDINTNKFDI
jgi:hypothetical protein